jgi:hypothetical protein
VREWIEGDDAATVAQRTASPPWWLRLARRRSRKTKAASKTRTLEKAQTHRRGKTVAGTHLCPSLLRWKARTAAMRKEGGTVQGSKTTRGKKKPMSPSAALMAHAAASGQSAATSSESTMARSSIETFSADDSASPDPSAGAMHSSTVAFRIGCCE